MPASWKPRRSSADGGEGTAPRAKRRLPLDVREEEILQKAIAFFADKGFHGTTRDLAQAIGISQPLLFHYFASKAALIERVFETLYSGRWRPAWGALIRDRSLPLGRRLTQFYTEYLDSVLTREWTRILFLAAMDKEELLRRNETMVRNRILLPLIKELRAELGMQTRRGAPTPIELELAWNLHASIFYLSLRTAILDRPLSLSTAESVRMAVTVFLEGVQEPLLGSKRQCSPMLLEVAADASHRPPAASRLDGACLKQGGKGRGQRPRRT